VHATVAQPLAQLPGKAETSGLPDHASLHCKSLLADIGTDAYARALGGRGSDSVDRSVHISNVTSGFLVFLDPGMAVTWSSTLPGQARW
jgi:hypothetical protein